MSTQKELHMPTRYPQTAKTNLENYDLQSLAMDKAAKRVLAPYLRTIRRSQKLAQEKPKEKEEFSFYLHKKPITVLQALSEFLSDSVDLPSLLHETADVLKNVTNSTGPGQTVASYVAYQKEFVILDDVIGDERFPLGVGWIGPMVKAVLCVPVVTPDDDCIAVIELYREVTEDLYTKIFAKATLGAERGSFFIIDPECEDELVADLFDESVAQLVNKQNAPCFSKTDENIFKTFSVYCALALHFSRLQEQMRKIDTRNDIKTEMLMYHMQPCTHDVQRVEEQPILEHLPDGFSTLLSFQQIGLLVAAIGHDIDHPGVTNNFLRLIDHSISRLYTESPLENHHFQVTMLVITTSKLFDHFSPEVFRDLTQEVHDAILATDLALYFRCRARILGILNEKEFDWTNGAQRILLKSIMMTTCDLSGQCKPFNITKRITENVYREFYRQGDIEKSMGQTPLSMMDREKQYSIPEDQIQFLSVVCLPCVELLCTLLPNCVDLLHQCKDLRDEWKEIMALKGVPVWRPEDSVVKQPD
ncbi:hypothetical protein C0J52_19328 [Blattella germanica]|nr:hypothetical protein C0J52_19328 [Blattella germanica]